MGVEFGMGFDPIVEGGRDESDLLPVVVDHGEAEGRFEVWEEFVSPDVLTSPPLPTSFCVTSWEVKNTEMGACIG